MLSVEEFIDDTRQFFAGNSFYETDMYRRSEQFGNIVHVFSTFESRWDKQDPQPFVRGINSIQLVRYQDCWWVMTVLWQNENSACPILLAYLPAGK